MEYYYENGEIHESWIGGPRIGVIENGEIHKDCIGGERLGVVDNDEIHKDWCGGEVIGNARDYIIHGMEDRPAEMVACWHFLIRKIF